MDIQVKEHGNILILQLVGEFDLYESSKVRDSVQTHMGPRKKSHLVIDMAKVSYLDSSGVGTLIHLQNQIKQSNGTMCLCSLQESPKKVLELTRLTRFFSITNNCTASIELISSGKST